jgi:ABC-type dipeptide/oligopeptide/nickel transport system permease subunit
MKKFVAGLTIGLLAGYFVAQIEIVLVEMYLQRLAEQEENNHLL